MYRQLLIYMQNWLHNSQRKPLVLRGARQTGKTWLVRELAKKENFQLIELNFEQKRHLATHFASNEPDTILLNLESALNININREKCILFLDEIQIVPELLAKLRWFYELMPELAVIATGSLLEFVLESHSFSMPVGRISYCFLEPMGFEEFLLAKNETHLLQAIKNFDLKKPFNDALHTKANQLFKEFMMVGGMPEAVSDWTSHRSLTTLAEKHSNLIQTYKDDFTKYDSKLDLQYLEEVFNHIPATLGKKFVYSHVNKAAKQSSIKNALNLLVKARLVNKVLSAYANGIPLGAEVNHKLFKTILIDVGLVSTMLGVKLYQFQTIDDILLINNGSLAEQVVGQLLRLLNPHFIDPRLYYWSREAQSSSAEVDYLLQYNQTLIPVEVKAGSAGKMRSLQQFFYEKPWTFAIRIYSGSTHKQIIKSQTTQGHTIHYELLSIPFYLISEIERFIEIEHS